MSERLTNPTPSVHRVPVEVLSSILLLSITFYDPNGDLWNVREQLANLQDLRLVCCLWNNIIDGDGRFWTACSVRIGQDPFFGTGPKMEQAIPVLRRFFERSQSLPMKMSMSVSFHGREVGIETFRPLVDFVSSFQNRWRCLSFVCLKPLKEAGLTWWLAFFEPLISVDTDNPVLRRPCYKNVQELSFETVYEEDASISIEDFPVSQVFPNVEKLIIHLDTIKKGDLLPQQLHGLHSLTYLRIFIDDLVDVEHRIPILHGILTELPQLQHLELDRLGVPPGDPLEDIPDVFLGDDTPLIHSSLKTLIITHAFNLPLFMFPVFPTLERLIVGNRFHRSSASYYAGRRPGPESMKITTRGAAPYYDKRWPSAEILENLMRMTPNRSNLHTLILSDIGISEDDLFTLLFETPSLESLHLKPPDPALCTGGRCLAQLFERSKTDYEATLVLPSLQSLSIDTKSADDEGGAGNNIDEVEYAFRAFVEDSRREKWESTSSGGSEQEHGEGAVERYQVLQEAILYVDGEETYWRSS
ncbi:hypothetical protein BKA70DRAFT_1231649 [Coprinopsis sp. MPI-PUGE-AT-0042]|nr:hypothetical protein BKA70DRAFT_1231649 [Coprinopsis sp. MPI-PUGE-AT-0042]